MTGKTYGEHIASLKATRDARTARREEIAKAAMDEARSMNDAEQQEFDDIGDEVKRLDADIARYAELEAADKASAKAVDDTAERKAFNANAPRGGVEIKTQEKLEPGIAAARYAICLQKAKGDHNMAFRLAERHYPQTEAVVQTLKAQAEGADLAEMMRVKTTIPAGTTTDSTWAKPLVYANTWGGDFVEFLRSRTLIGQAQFRPVPFNVRIGQATSGGTGYWVGEGKPKPVTKFGFDALFSSYTKVAAIAVITDELARFSDPSAEVLVRDMLADAAVEAIDTRLFATTQGAANVSPNGLLYNVTPSAAPATSSIADIRAAIACLFAPWDASHLGARPAFYMTPAVARFLAFAQDALGNPAFPGMTSNGGTLFGVPVRVSQYLAAVNTTDGGPLILVDEAEIYLADDGSVTLDASREATIEMTDLPTGSASATVAAQSVMPVSMFQSNSIAIRAERYTWWGLRRAGAVQWIDAFPTGC